MSLKNFTKIKLKKNNRSYWKIYKVDGLEVTPFTEWTLYIQDRFAFQTRDKYSQVVSKFLDYLVEVDVFEKVVTRLEFKAAIENYKKILAHGKNIADKKLKEVAVSLNFNPIGSSSWSNNLSAINSFLEYIFELEEDNREYLALKKKINLSADFKSILPELSLATTLNSYQKESLKQRSFLANLYRSTGEIKISSGLKSTYSKKKNKDFKNLDFPALEIPKLLNSTSCFRDKAIYSLMAGTGIRSSEALSLTWDMVDISNQKIFIYENDGVYDEDIRFKGRDTNLTFFIPELRHIFFSALYQYQLKEADSSSSHNYVFHYLKGNAHGDPYYKVSRQGFIKEFKKTVLRANVSSPSFCSDYIWTPHSLRHFYGVYMLNYIPLNNKFGFSIEEVQKMMGHRSVTVTQKYARRPDEYIKEQLEYAEMRIAGNDSISSFSNLFISNLKGDNHD